jgi:hypothetical protein
MEERVRKRQKEEWQEKIKQKRKGIISIQKGRIHGSSCRMKG